MLRLTRAPHRNVMALIAILMATAIFRTLVADHSLWFDEQAAVYFSDQPYSLLWSDWMLRETNPPLYYSILRLWREIGGSSDLMIRVPSIVASLIVIALLFRISSRLYGPSAGVIAALLSALSGQHLYYSEQARAYIFVMCATLVAVNALMTALWSDADPRAKRHALVLYFLAATAGIYLHTTMILFPFLAFLAVVAADFLRVLKRPRSLVPLVVANVAVLLASIWAIRIAVLQIVYQRDNIAAIGLVSPSQSFKLSIKTLFFVTGEGRLAYLIALPLVTLIFVWAVVNRRSTETRFLVALALIALIVFAALGMIVPVFVPRTIFWISAITCLLTGGAMAWLATPVLRGGAVALLAGLLAFNSVQTASNLEIENWNAPVDVISRYPGALMLVQGEAMAVLSESVCHRLRNRPCPYTVVAASDPEDHYDTWARGLYTGPKVPIESLERYSGGRTVFLFRKQWYHNIADALHERGLGRGVPANGPPLLGPLSASALGAR